MEQILRIFYKNGSFFTFAGLQLLCLYLIVNFNSPQSAIAVETASIFTGSVKSGAGTVEGYLNLAEENEIQRREIADLRSRLPEAGYSTTLETDSIEDKTYAQRFIHLTANVINRSPFSPNNTLVIDRGTGQGVAAGQGLVGREGLIGIVDLPTENFSRVISILHRSARISAGLRNNAYGTLQWDGTDPRRMILTDIADYLTVMEGDTVFTTGFSNVFPTGQVIGTVESSEVQPGTGSQNLIVRLINDPLHTNNVFVVRDLFKDELAKLKPLK
ncbi:rod shape-determining protein MreC [Neolewinella aurantiaca]|uniref:Cell shape-determining protein MreC n=1 Tax=Neolewinella aurantiaca TaxID=2602767 RepID=A0A5C7FU38_9BACT|nr:rod shape-determining protein MreC [Neolewinella aurantiaca]TXF90062.1 rod shape-determining protein MreC [Neolewinella aurantiaca]